MKKQESLTRKGKVKESLRWIESEILRIGAYHDHKEQLTWKVTALYVPAVITVANVAADSGLCWRQKLYVSLMMAGVFGLSLMFMRTLFSTRWRAHDEVVALERARGKLIANPESVLKKLAIDKPNDDEIPVWPQFVTEELGLSRTSWFERAWVSLKLVFSWKWAKIDLRVANEVVLYVVLFVSTGFGIWWMWNKPAG